MGATRVCSLYFYAVETESTESVTGGKFCNAVPRSITSGCYGLQCYTHAPVSIVQHADIIVGRCVYHLVVIFKF